ncbi:hypothetical protein OSTOST_03955, partial [Ostertagia ostertagi]
IYDFYVHSCYAHDGTNTADASINIIDSNGCAVRLSRAVDVPAFTTEPINHGPKHVYLHILPLHNSFTLNVKSNHACTHVADRFDFHHLLGFFQPRRNSESSNLFQQCEPDAGKAPLIPALRRRREEVEKNATLTTLRMQTVLEIEPQQVQRAALISHPVTPDHCVSLNEVVFAGLLLLGAIVSLVALSCFMCSPTKRPLPREEPAYSVSQVFRRIPIKKKTEPFPTFMKWNKGKEDREESRHEKEYSTVFVKFKRLEERKGANHLVQDTR